MKTSPDEFGGPIGTGLTIILLPITVLYLTTADKFEFDTFKFPQLNSLFQFDAKMYFKCFLILIGWIIFQAIFYLLPLGRTVEGVTLSNNRKLRYNINGLISFIVTHFLLLLCYYLEIDISFLYLHFQEFAVMSILFSIVLSIYLYISSFREGLLLAESGQSGYLTYDFFMGRELNPRIGNLDLKFFFETRPGLIGWVILNYACFVYQYQKHAQFTASMILVNAFHFAYCLDAFIYEESILTMMDITTDGFGYMLAFGDMSWVPFTFTVQARFLAQNPIEMSTTMVIITVGLWIVGYYIFRTSNSIKNGYRQNPNAPEFEKLKTMSTKRGTNLIVSGLWGICRHPNYLGDLMMGLAWCLTCGFSHILPYFYIIYFTVLLVHREMRDSSTCKKKYGNDWERYCWLVPYKIIPYVY